MSTLLARTRVQTEIPPCFVRGQRRWRKPGFQRQTRKVDVQLLKTIPELGYQGQVVRVTAASMRNYLYLHNRATYILDGETPPLPVISSQEGRDLLKKHPSYVAMQQRMADAKEAAKQEERARKAMGKRQQVALGLIGTPVGGAGGPGSASNLDTVGAMWLKFQKSRKKASPVVEDKKASVKQPSTTTTTTTATARPPVDKEEDLLYLSESLQELPDTLVFRGRIRQQKGAESKTWHRLETPILLSDIVERVEKLLGVQVPEKVITFVVRQEKQDKPVDDATKILTSGNYQVKFTIPRDPQPVIRTIVVAESGAPLPTSGQLTIVPSEFVARPDLNIGQVKSAVNSDTPPIEEEEEVKEKSDTKLNEKSTANKVEKKNPHSEKLDHFAWETSIMDDLDK